MDLEMSCTKWEPFSLNVNVLTDHRLSNRSEYAILYAYFNHVRIEYYVMHPGSSRRGKLMQYKNNAHVCI